MVANDNPSFILEKQYSLKFEDRPIPELKDPHDVIIIVKYTGICGSDVHYWQEGRIGHYVVKDPMVLGHESSGVVHKVGEAVTSVKPGDNVAIEPSIPCRLCSHCKSGNYNLCPYMAFAATPPVDGTLCRYYTAPEDMCFKLPDHISLQEGAMVEPLSVAVHIVRQGQVKPGQSVVVFGAGPVGLLTLAVAQAFGATTLVTVDVNEDRVRFAKDFVKGAHAFIPKKGESPIDGAERMRKECGLGSGDHGRGADVCLEATGAEPCIQQAISVLRTGGTFVQGGMGKPEITFPITSMCTKELNVRGSFRYSAGDYDLAVELLGSGKIDVKPAISQVFDFNQAEEAFEKTKKGEGIKLLIKGPAE